MAGPTLDSTEHDDRGQRNDTPSFRQMGVTKGGRVVKGSSTGPIGMLPQRSQPSIPSKFETIFNPANVYRERDGFMRRTHRWDAGEYCLTPGPGQYKSGRHDTNSFIMKTTSLGIGGYGAGFVSRSRRMGPRRRFDSVPGPGRYGTQSSIRTLSKSKASASAPFLTSKRPDILPKTRRVPGPGAYGRPRLPSDIDYYYNTRARMAGIGSLVERFPNDRSKSAQGGESLESIFRRSLSEHQLVHKKSRRASRPTAAFSSKTKRGTYLQIPTESGKEPGPGSYDVRGAPKHDEEPLPCSAFNSSGRVGKPVRPPKETLLPDQQPLNLQELYHISEGPGPGAYHSKKQWIKANPVHIGSSSAFASKSSRLRSAKSEEVPGPGKYHPKMVPLKHYFHVNKRRQWL